MGSITQLPISTLGNLASGLGVETGTSLLSSVLGDVTSAVPFIGPVIQAITSFLNIGGGCGQTCVESAKLEQVFAYTGHDILQVVKNGMLSGYDGAALMGTVYTEGQNAMAQLAFNGDSKAEGGIKNMATYWPGMIKDAASYGKAIKKLDISSAQALFFNPATPGVYPESIVSANTLASQILNAYITQGLQAAESTDLSGVLNNILSGLNNQLVSAQNGASSTTKSILGGLAGLLGVAQAAGTDTGSKILSGILGTIGLSNNTANTIASDVSSALNDLTGFIQKFNTDVIGKLVNPVLESINKAQTLQTALESDLQNGLTGILQIPSQLAGYLTSQQAIAKQTVDLTNQNRTSVASDILTPGIGGAIANPLTSLHDTLTTFLGSQPTTVEEFSPINLSESQAENNFTHDFNIAKQQYNNPKGMIEHLAHWIVSNLVYFTGWSASIEPGINLATQAANQQIPTQLIPISGIISLLHRNLITWTQAITEANKQGLDGTRLFSLYTLEDSLLNVNETVNAFYRGIIDQSAMDAEFNYNNYDAGRQQVILELAKYLPDVGTAANWFARGFITPERFREILQFNRWTSDETDIAQQAMFAPANPSEYARFKARVDAASRGFLPDAYGSNPPNDINSVNRQNQRSEEQAKLDWVAHWKELGIYDYVNAYYRGLITEDVFNEALGSLNIPSELNKLLADVNRPLIPFFYLTEMLAAGIFTEEQARALLAQYGFNEDAITASIKFGNFKAIGKATDQNTALAQISVSQLKTMYDDNIISKSQLIISLEEHGYNSEVATLLAALYETQKQLTANKEYATMIIDQVKLGRITKLQALDDLNARGYTQAQIAAYELDIEKVKIANGKLPTKAQFDDFWKKQIIDDSTYLAALELLGYSQQYATMFLALLQAG